MGIFEDRESAVRTYCRKWPVVFDRAVGSYIYDEDGSNRRERQADRQVPEFLLHPVMYSL